MTAPCVFCAVSALPARVPGPGSLELGSPKIRHEVVHTVPLQASLLQSMLDGHLSSLPKDLNTEQIAR